MRAIVPSMETHQNSAIITSLSLTDIEANIDNIIGRLGTIKYDLLLDYLVLYRQVGYKVAEFWYSKQPKWSAYKLIAVGKVIGVMQWVC